jgi:hypothetical protein
MDKNLQLFPGGSASPGTVTLLGQRDDEDQRGEGADTDPDPLLLRQSGCLELIEVLSELVKILRGHLRQFLVNLFLTEALGSEDLRNLIVRGHIADEGQIGITGCHALVGRRLRGGGTGKSGDRGDYEDQGKNEENRFLHTHGKYFLLNLVSSSSGRQGRDAVSGDGFRIAQAAREVPGSALAFGAAGNSLWKLVR